MWQLGVLKILVLVDKMIQMVSYFPNPEIDKSLIIGRSMVGKALIRYLVMEKGWTSDGDIQPIFVADTSISVMLYQITCM